MFFEIHHVFELVKDTCAVFLESRNNYKHFATIFRVERIQAYF